MGRYTGKKIEKNSSEFYETYLEQRGISHINQYTSPEFTYPTENQNNTILYITHIWTYGDRYYKLANNYYGDPTLWWVIAMYNNKPTEHNVSLGEEIKIPSPVQKILSYMKP
jgi:nucleoid-associated protein YgaU